MTNPSIHTQGSKFKRGSGSGPVVYTSVAGILDIAPPGSKRKALDVTTLDQTSIYKEVVGSVLVENEPIEIELLFDPDSTIQATLKADMEDPDPVPYRVELRNGDTFDFNGVITAWKPSGKMDDNYKVKVTVEVSGAVTYTAAT